MRLYTTLRLLREAEACADGYRNLRESLPGSWRDDDKIDFLHILAFNGVDDTLWALRAVIPEQAADAENRARRIAVELAERVLPLYENRHPDNDAPRRAVEAARKFADGEISRDELTAASRSAAADLAVIGAAAEAEAQALAMGGVRAAQIEAAVEAARAASWTVGVSAIVFVGSVVESAAEAALLASGSNAEYYRQKTAIRRHLE
jgi:hypothetical protein